MARGEGSFHPEPASTCRGRIQSKGFLMGPWYAPVFFLRDLTYGPFVLKVTKNGFMKIPNEAPTLGRL